MTSMLHQEIAKKGYAIVENLLDAEALNDIVSDYEQLLDRLAPEWYAQGRISWAYADLPFDQRLTAVLGESSEDLYQHFDIALPNSSVSPDTPIHLSRAVFDLLRNKRVLDKVEEVVGGEILSNPIQHVRIKPARAKVASQPSGLLKTTGWHQDQGVARSLADDTEMLTVWLAITDATVENGCLQVVPYSHRDGITLHCPGEQLVIPKQLLRGEPLPLPINAGDAIFMHQLTQHASLAESQRYDSLEFRPALSADWHTDRTGRIPQPDRAQPPQPGARTGLRDLARFMAGGASASGRRDRTRSHQPLGR